MRVRRFRPALIAAGVTVLTTCLLFGCYVVFAKTEMTDAARTWTRNYQAGFAPKGEGSELLQSAYTNMLRSAGDEHAGAYLLGVLFLIVRWRLRQALFLLFGALLIYGIVLNSVFWFLPGSVALYPERAPYLINALSMLSLALAWHALPLWSRRLKRGWGMLGILLVCVGLLKYIPCYQRCVTHQALPPEQPYETSYPLIGAAEYESLIWCRNHLHAGQDMVQARYNSVGSYLPSVAGIATSAWHIHCFVIPYEQKILADRHPTHRLIVLSKEGEPTVGSGTEVFRNSAIVILRLW